MPSGRRHTQDNAIPMTPSDTPLMDARTGTVFGQHLQNLRNERGISLSRLAADAGIAKSNLSKIEQGEGNPTLDTIWRLAICLGVPFGDLVAPLGDSLVAEGIRVRLIDQGRDQRRVDVYWLAYEPGVVRCAEAHALGADETVMVIRGALELVTGAGEQATRTLLHAGDSLTFAADQPHEYRAQAELTHLLVTMVYAARDC